MQFIPCSCSLTRELANDVLDDPLDLTVDPSTFRRPAEVCSALSERDVVSCDQVRSTHFGTAKEGIHKRKEVALRELNNILAVQRTAMLLPLPRTWLRTQKRYKSSCCAIMTASPNQGPTYPFSWSPDCLAQTL